LLPDKVAVVLAHGAGGTMDTGLLPQYAEKFASLGFPCVRFNYKAVNLPQRVAAMKVRSKSAYFGFSLNCIIPQGSGGLEMEKKALAC
jgi:predicted alpha/beta-hydrolase family hydrolase